jgi:hypothetical protein
MDPVNDFLVSYLDAIDERLLEYLDDDDELKLDRSCLSALEAWLDVYPEMRTTDE